MTMRSRVLGALVAALTIVGIVAGSHGRLSAFASPDAMIRVSWSARPERIDVCRRISDEELAKTPVHMRRQFVCEGTTARYRLVVARDGELADSVTVRGGGLRQDREVYVSRGVLVPAGSARISVRFVRLDSSSGPSVVDSVGPPTDPAVRPEAAPDSTRAGEITERAVRERQERERRLAEAIPPVLSLDTVVTLASRSVILVTYDPDLRRLVVKAARP